MLDDLEEKKLYVCMWWGGKGSARELNPYLPWREIAM